MQARKYHAVLKTAPIFGTIFGMQERWLGQAI